MSVSPIVLLVNTPQFCGQNMSDIHKTSAYVNIGLLDYIIMFLGVQCAWHMSLLEFSARSLRPVVDWASQGSSCMKGVLREQAGMTGYRGLEGARVERER